MTPEMLCLGFLALLAIVAAAVVDRRQTSLQLGLADTNKRLAETHISLMREDMRLHKEQKELDRFLWKEAEVLTAAAEAVEHLKERIDSMEKVQDIFTRRIADGTFQVSSRPVDGMGAVAHRNPSSNREATREEKVSPAKVGGSKGVTARRRK